MVNSQQPIRDDDSGNFEISRHARAQLVARWPETVLPFRGFDSIVVPRDARIIGYDPTTSTYFLDVPNTPMVALVSGDIVVTVLTADSATSKLKLHGFSSEDV